MASTRDSRQTVFRQIARRQYRDWPSYAEDPVCDQSTLAGLESDIRTVAETWFGHDAHHSVEEFVASLPLVYFGFEGLC